MGFTPKWKKTRGDLAVAVTAYHTITEAGFWRRLTLLTLFDLYLLQTRSFLWLTHCSTSNSFSSMKTKLGSVLSVMRSRISCALSSRMISCVSVSSCLFCILQRDVLRSSLRMCRIEIALIPASRANFETERRGFLLSFSLAFLVDFLVRIARFLPWPGRLHIFLVYLSFFTTFQTFSRLIWRFFAMK